MPVLKYLSAIRFSDTDAGNFLQNQLSADVLALGTGESTFACYCEPKGRVLALMLVCRLEDAFLVTLSSELAQSVADRMKIYIMRSKVNIEVLNGARRDGAASRANGGTLFLDEVCEMNLELQSKLLRFIQSGTFQRVGDSKEEKVDVRFICATNREPLNEVKAGRFREDLYYRLNVIPLHLPPLSERGDDIMLIASDMLSRMAKEEGKSLRGFSSAVAGVFQRYSWPGNVRELENVIRNIVVLNSGEQITNEMLPHQFLAEVSALDKDRAEEMNSSTSVVNATPMVSGEADQKPLLDISVEESTIAAPEISADSSQISPLWQAEKNIIERAIAICEGNIPRAAAFLEISASTIYRKIQTWDKRLEE